MTMSKYNEEQKKIIDIASKVWDAAKAMADESRRECGTSGDFNVGVCHTSFDKSEGKAAYMEYVKACVLLGAKPVGEDVEDIYEGFEFDCYNTYYGMALEFPKDGDVSHNDILDFIKKNKKAKMSKEEKTKKSIRKMGVENYESKIEDEAKEVIQHAKDKFLNIVKEEGLVKTRSLSIWVKIGRTAHRVALWNEGVVDENRREKGMEFLLDNATVPNAYILKKSSVSTRNGNDITFYLEKSHDGFTTNLTLDVIDGILACANILDGIDLNKEREHYECAYEGCQLHKMTKWIGKADRWFVDGVLCGEGSEGLAKFIGNIKSIKDSRFINSWRSTNNNFKIDTKPILYGNKSNIGEEAIKDIEFELKKKVSIENIKKSA